MGKPPETCWTVIRGAAAGARREREELARRYVPVVTAYLRARWRGTPRLADTDDAVQEVFVDCFRREGALERLDEERGGGFRAFLYGIVRLVALRFEERRRVARERQPPTGFEPGEITADEPSLSHAFDRAWARSIMARAAEVQAERAPDRGSGAERRVELLRLRFDEEMPIREIARRWEEDPARLHREYAKARREFREALLEVVAFHHPGAPEEVEEEAARLLDFFS